MYTYFIITPGYAVNSYVRYPDAAEGNYVKFGDAAQAHGGAGIRAAYLTHNPDIGVAAVMDSTAFANPYLGTRLKNHIAGRGYGPVGTSEWFSVRRQDAWGLFGAMQAWDNVAINLGNYPALLAAIDVYFP